MGGHGQGTAALVGQVPPPPSPVASLPPVPQLVLEPSQSVPPSPAVSYTSAASVAPQLVPEPVMALPQQESMEGPAPPPAPPEPTVPRDLLDTVLTQAYNRGIRGAILASEYGVPAPPVPTQPIQTGEVGTQAGEPGTDRETQQGGLRV